MWRHGGSQRWMGGRVVLAVAVVTAAAMCLGCSSETTTEATRDPADVTVPGPRPTAPAEDPDSGLSESGNALLAELEAVSEVTDLCEVLTGAAFTQLLSEDFDVASLVTSPSGITQLLVLIDSTFSQLVAISPAEVRPSMQIVQEVWTRVASLNTGAADAEARTAEILAEPQVVGAGQTLAAWTTANCPSGADAGSAG